MGYVLVGVIISLSIITVHAISAGDSMDEVFFSKFFVRDAGNNLYVMDEGQNKRIKNDAAAAVQHQVKIYAEAVTVSIKNKAFFMV